jgi:hypothetical protein
MGRSQIWITYMDPEHLLNKDCGGDKIEQGIGENEVGQENFGQENSYNNGTEWKTGLIPGDPFEERVVVLYPASLQFAKSKIDLVQTCQALRVHFLSRLRDTLGSAASNLEPDPVLILAFCHGDFETGGLLIGAASNPKAYMTITDVAAILAEYPQVPVTIFRLLATQDIG